MRVANISPEDDVEVKQLLVANGCEAKVDSGELKLSCCPWTDVAVLRVTSLIVFHFASNF